MFQYTKATLKAFLNTWVEGNGAQADADFIAAHDEIIQRGELRLSRDLDLDNLDTFSNAATVATTEAALKPTNLVTERVVVLTTAGVRTILDKRHRAFVEAFNLTGATGIPRYYAEADELNWVFAPIPAAIYPLRVHGIYRPASIIDGADGGTTWFSTRVPDLLATACAIEAAELLKFWARKAVAERDYTAKLDDARGLTVNLRRSDIESILAGGVSLREPTQPPNPAATV